MTFLIRTKENRIFGPFPKEEVVARIERGELRELDEVCPANGYWIYLHERGESMEMLGIELAHTIESGGEEITETETETATATVTSNGSAPVPVVASAATHPAGPATPDRTELGRPETVGTLRFVLWGFLLLIVFILYRVFQLAQDP